MRWTVLILIVLIAASIISATPNSTATDLLAFDATAKLELVVVDECSICLDPLEETQPMHFNCTHNSFHSTCIFNTSKRVTCCPLCRAISINYLTVTQHQQAIHALHRLNHAAFNSLIGIKLLTDHQVFDYTKILVDQNQITLLKTLRLKHWDILTSYFAAYTRHFRNTLVIKTLIEMSVLSTAHYTMHLHAIRRRDWHVSNAFIAFYKSHPSPAYTPNIGKLILLATQHHAPSMHIRSLFSHDTEFDATISYDHLFSTVAQCIHAQQWNKLLVLIEYVNRSRVVEEYNAVARVGLSNEQRIISYIKVNENKLPRWLVNAMHALETATVD